jgi:hypothetical protein
MHIALVNHSTQVTDAQAQLMARACATQLQMHAAPVWDRLPASVIWYADEAHVPPGSHVIALFDSGDQSQALGWHTEEQGEAIYGRVFCQPVLSNGGNVLTKPLSIASVLSHEVLETWVDPSVNLWVDDGRGVLHALEVCDPVEAGSYFVQVDATSVSISDFCTPQWFDAQARPADQFNWLKTLTHPFQLARGGYEVVRRAGGEQQHFADEPPPEWRQATKQTPLSRTAKRLAQASAET